MCGIFGFIKNKTFAEKVSASGFNWATSNYGTDSEVNLVKNLMLPTALRGIDSTGFALVDHENNNASVKKLPVNPIEFLKYGEYDEVETFANYDKIGIIGHCRAGTIGSIQMNTTHPFHLESVIGVHNGTLNYYDKLSKKKSFSDSHALYQGLDECDIVTDYLETLTGSFALVWYDLTTKKYYFARNKDRPLYYFKDTNLLSFASEKEILDFGMKRTYGNSFKEEHYQAIQEVKDHTLYEIDPTNLDITTYEFKERIFTKAKIDTKEYKNNTWSNQNYLPKATVNETWKESLPVKPGDRTTLVPCGYLEYENSKTGYGSIYGYFTSGTKSFYWISYGIQNVKEWLSDYFTEVLSNGVDLSGKLTHVSLQHKNSRKEAVDMVDPMTNLKIFPTRDEKDNDSFIVYSVENSTLNYYQNAVFN